MSKKCEAVHLRSGSFLPQRQNTSSAPLPPQAGHPADATADPSSRIQLPFGIGFREVPKSNSRLVLVLSNSLSRRPLQETATCGFRSPQPSSTLAPPRNQYQSGIGLSIVAKTNTNQELKCLQERVAADRHPSAPTAGQQPPPSPWPHDRGSKRLPPRTRDGSLRNPSSIS